MSNGYGNNVYSKISDRLVHPMVKIWEDFMQTAVPEGCCIHHIDEDKTNNDIDNLVCMSIKDHNAYHLKKRCTGRKLSEEHKKKLSEIRTGKLHTEETKRKQSESQLGREFSEETKLKMKQSAKNKQPISEETRKKLSDARKGRVLTEEHRKKISEATRGKKKTKKL
jgi:hypothetical protein